MRYVTSRRTWSAIFIQGLFIYAWLTNLIGTDSYYSVYVLCAAAGLACLLENRREGIIPAEHRLGLLLAAAVFSLAVILANWPVFEPLSLLALFNVGCTFLGGWTVGMNILRWAMNRLPFTVSSSHLDHPGRVFTAVFLSVAALDLAYLFSSAYPGVLTTDSVSTMRQIVYGAYDNTMPFWHTMVVRLFCCVGSWLFGDIHAGIAFFHCGQILFLAACFGYTVMTLYQAGVPKWCVALVWGLYALLPYNIVYSVTLWKDVPFAASTQLFVTALYRILWVMEKSRRMDNALFTLGGVGISLLRTNGWFAFLVVGIVMLAVLRGRHRGLLVRIALVLGVCWMLLNPVLRLLNVPGTDMVEATAVPMQQVARVIANGRELGDDEEELLAMAFNLDRVPQDYTPWSVDTMKFENFRREDLDYLREHLWDYVKLYLRLGLRYPGDYLKAWIEETKGYWNGGYSFWIYTRGVDTNELGIQSATTTNLVSRLFAAAFRYLEKPDIFQCLYSIGLYVWGLFACLLVNLWKKREEFLLTIPGVVLILGLWLGTPVYAEFRYAYPVFLTLPLIVCATLFSRDSQPMP